MLKVNITYIDSKTEVIKLATTGQRIKELRYELNLRQLDLASICHVSRSTISLYESNKIEPGFEVKSILATHFNVSMDFLSGRSNIRNPEHLISVNSKKLVKVPIIGTIRAGSPILALENIEKYFLVPTEYANDGTYFFLRVSGDSMINARIMDGDLVYCRKQSHFDSGDILVVLIDTDSATLKRVLKLDHSIILQPENPKYKPTVFTQKQVENGHVQVLGKVINVIFKV